MQANLLIEAFADPRSLAKWTNGEWGLAVRQARSANLLGALGTLAAHSLPEAEIPEAARQHFLAAHNLVGQRTAAVVWESNQILKVLARQGIGVIFLKGAAYALSGFPFSVHRHFSDIDIMVRLSDLPQAEKSLMLAGWLPNNGDAYDQRYYRQWMHEIPPLRHIRRGTVLDLHHGIAPPTARYRVNSELLWASRVAMPSLPGAYVLECSDMVLHAIVHLFSEGESENALRNLLDVSDMLDQFMVSPGFTVDLVNRSVLLGLGRPLYYAVRYLSLVLKQERRESLMELLAPQAPGRITLAAMDALYIRVFQGGHPSSALPGHSLARNALYIRGHWLRMPVHLLVPHLGRKLVRSRRRSAPA